MQRLRVGDLVQVIAGRDKGKTGKITRILRDEGRVIVEGIHVVTRHQKPDQSHPEGGRLEKEAPIHASNVMPMEATTKKPTRVKFVVDEDGTKSRVAVNGSELETG